MAGSPNELILCGWDEVFILDLAQAEDDRPRKVWSWRAKDRPELPERMKAGNHFASTDECKPVRRGEQILISSSGWGLALVERATGQALWYGEAENAHSIDLLPGNRAAIAASGHIGDDEPVSADSLLLFDLGTPERELYRTPLLRGHGVVWDEGRQVLWALATQEVCGYQLVDWETDRPSLEQVLSVELPEAGGHDLHPVPNTPLLSVSTFRHCWLLDRDTRALAPHPQLGDTHSVKCISTNPVTGQVAYVQAEGDEWWAERVHFLGPEGVLYLPGEHLYKVRWNQAAP